MSRTPIACLQAGEDRFMDSLFVSGDGTKCVCGDEAQKPFPLLVWDLEKRKLSHDIRIQGHEFVTRMGAITNDGHYIVSACRVRANTHHATDTHNHTDTHTWARYQLDFE